jgi:hypothetical protein
MLVHVLLLCNSQSLTDAADVERYSRNFCFDYTVPSVLASSGVDGCLWADVVDSAGLNTPGIRNKSCS